MKKKRIVGIFVIVMIAIILGVAFLSQNNSDSSNQPNKAKITQSTVQGQEGEREEISQAAIQTSQNSVACFTFG